MKWILFHQMPIGDRVKYINNDMDNHVTMRYYKFREYLFKNYNIVRKQELQTSLDRFETVFLDGETGKWNIEKIENNNSYSFDSLYELNMNRQKEKEEDKKSVKENIIEKAHNFIDSLWYNKTGKNKNDKRSSNKQQRRIIV